MTLLIPGKANVIQPGDIASSGSSKLSEIGERKSLIDLFDTK
jgi:hypothetical protein